jgi:hypothetical protein
MTFAKGNTIWLGRHLSEEHKSNIRKGLAGKPKSAEHKRHLSESKLGRPWPKSVEWRRQMSIRQTGQRLGAKNPRWQGGVTSKNNLIRTSVAMDNWRRAVFERDSYTCQRCGDNSGGNLVAHHLIPFASKYGKNLRLSVGNGWTVCAKCHKEMHTGPQQTNNIIR